MIRRTTRSLRAFVAALTLFALVPAIGTFAATPATIEQTATAVKTQVLPTTQMWVVDFVFTFPNAIDCSDGPQSVDIHFKIQNNVGTDVLPIPSGGTTGIAEACVRDYPNLAPNQAVVHFDLLGAQADSFEPSAWQDVVDALGVTVSTFFPSKVLAKAKLHPAGQTQDTLPFGAPLGPVFLPTAPVWIGMGDGYSSQVVQTPDTCITTECYDANDELASWIQKASDDINLARIQANNANSRWSLEPMIIAQHGAQSAAVAVNGSQNTQMLAELNRRVISRPAVQGGALPSWNWVSVSAGLEDVGLPGVMRAYSAAADGSPAGGRFPYDNAANPKPWDVPSNNAPQCPDLGNVAGTTGVLGRINGAEGAAIIPNLTSMKNSALNVDAAVHIVQVIYPWLTEPSNPCASDHDGLASNRTVMQRLRQVTDVTGDTTDNVVALDLQDPVKGFGDVPTGVAPTREGSRLWLSRPFGYPFPSRDGVNAMKSSATIIVGSAAADVLPPTVTGRPIEPPAVSDGPLWWNRQLVHIQWDAEDPSGLDEPSTAIWKPDGRITDATIEGLNNYLSPEPDPCDITGRCGKGNLWLGIDYTAPTNVAWPDRAPDFNGWYNAAGGPVTITWTADDTKYSTTQVVDGDGNPVFDGFGNPMFEPVLDENGNPIQTAGVRAETVPSPVPVENSSATEQIFGGGPDQVCDFATNCVDVDSAGVKVDFVYPTLSSSLASSGGTSNGWYRTPVTVSWTDIADAHSGVDASASSTQTGTLERGTRTFIGTVCDNAGNCTTQDVIVQVDNEAPTVTLGGGAVEGDTYPATGVPQVTCAAVDQADLSGLTLGNECQLTVVKGTPDADGKTLWTVSATSTDKAGNTSAPVSVSFYVASDGSTPQADERMTGEATYKSSTYGKVDIDLSLRCSGSASSLNVEWGKSAFELDDVNDVLCTDDPGVDGPGPFDTLTLNGSGTYCTGGSFGDSDYHEDDDDHGGWWNDTYKSSSKGKGSKGKSSKGKSSKYSKSSKDTGETDRHGGCSSYPGETVKCVTGTISLTFVDADGTGRTDTVRITIKDDRGRTVLSINGRIYDGNLITDDGSTPAADVIPPTVTPTLTSSDSPENGWYQSKVKVSWKTADTGGSGLVTSTPPSSTTVTSNGIRTITTPEVCDRAGNCSVGTVTVKIDNLDPTVSISGASSGTTYGELPVISCAATDQATLSGLDGECELTYTTKNVTGGTSYTYTATATDLAGNTSTKTLTFKVATAPANDGNGRMTGGGTLRSTGVNVSFTLRCNGSPNMLNVFFEDKRFWLEHVDALECYDDPAFGPSQPRAQFDTLVSAGTGKLSDGRTATIVWKFTDRGEPGTKDTGELTISVNGTNIFSVGETALSAGNFQAHESQGNGTNNNGNWNGPNGRSRDRDRDGDRDDYSAADWSWSDGYGRHTVTHDRSGSCNYKVENGRGSRSEHSSSKGRTWKSSGKDR